MKTNSKTNAQFDDEHHESPSFDSVSNGAKFAERIRVNRQKLCSDLKSQYDFHLAETPDVSVLLLEAGGDDEVPSVMEAGQWPSTLGPRGTESSKPHRARLSTAGLFP